MIRNILLPAVMAIFLPTAVALAGQQETWSVSEGSEGELQGYWTVDINGDEISANALMFDAEGEPLTYSVLGKRNEGSFFLQRLSPSNGVICSYTLQETPKLSDEPLPISIPSECNGKPQMVQLSKNPDPQPNENRSAE